MPCKQRAGGPIDVEALDRRLALESFLADIPVTDPAPATLPPPSPLPFLALALALLQTPLPSAMVAWVSVSRGWQRGYCQESLYEERPWLPHVRHDWSQPVPTHPLQNTADYILHLPGARRTPEVSSRSTLVSQDSCHPWSLVSSSGLPSTREVWMSATRRPTSTLTCCIS